MNIFILVQFMFESLSVFYTAVFVFLFFFLLQVITTVTGSQASFILVLKNVYFSQKFIAN